MSKVATRFAPSPTGALHIGGVRTALFNWLYSKNQKGTFHLRIEDTDKERSKEEHKIQIIKSLNWLGIKHDGEEYIQSSKIDDHVKIANELLKNGYAYKCYCTPEEIEEQKKRARQKKIPYIYNRKWRDAEEKDATKENKPVIRYKSKIKESKIKMGLKLQNIIDIPDNQTKLIYGSIEHIYIDDIALEDNGDINLQVINDIGIGGLNNYYKLEKIAHYPYFRV